jgi:predicted phage-related endonuclease
MTEEVKQARIGYITGSNMEKALAKGAGLTRRKYMLELIGERTTGQPSKGFQSQAMLDGIANEKFAVAWYESVQGFFTEETGFIKHPTIPWYGSTPDRLIGDAGLLEIKNPIRENFLDFKDNPKIDRGYILQMQTQLDCTGRTFCEHLVYSTDYNCGVMVRVDRDEEIIAEIHEGVKQMNADIDAFIERHGLTVVI